MFKAVVFEFSLMHLLLLSEFDLKHYTQMQRCTLMAG